MIFVSKYFVPRGYSGITLFPFVILKNSSLKQNERFMNHERIHLRQQLELLILPFFVWYVLEFLIRYCHYQSWALAYRNISFEREAYSKEKDLDYLSSRPYWNFLKYLLHIEDGRL